MYIKKFNITRFPPFLGHTEHASAKCDSQVQRTRGGNRQHAPCTDGCTPGYEFRAADVRRTHTRIH